MTTAYLGLGSNIGNRKDHLLKALAMISSKVGEITKISSLYESEAWGYQSGHKYLNAVIAVETPLYPGEILSDIKEVEKQLGRKKTKNGEYEDRPIDIDILFYDRLLYETDNLAIPHPHMANRKFVLEPLAEIAPDFVHPVLNKKIKELNDACTDSIQLYEK
jgi:2-amino-4-hydroxy-6-hydroxymethyldihydropteridine diphosphokinase